MYTNARIVWIPWYIWYGAGPGVSVGRDQARRRSSGHGVSGAAEGASHAHVRACVRAGGRAADACTPGARPGCSTGTRACARPPPPGSPCAARGATHPSPRPARCRARSRRRGAWAARAPRQGLGTAAVETPLGPVWGRREAVGTRLQAMTKQWHINCTLLQKGPWWCTVPSQAACSLELSHALA